MTNQYYAIYEQPQKIARMLAMSSTLLKSSFNTPSTVLLAVLEAWMSPILERSHSDASSFACVAKHKLVIFLIC